MINSVLLVGPPGSGKTTMAMSMPGKKLVIDADAKLQEMYSMRDRIESGEIIVWELKSPLIADSLRQRVVRLSEMRQTVSEPRGILEFVDLCADLDTKPDAKNADVWVIDSLTRISEHAKKFITHHGGTATMRIQHYGIYNNLFEEIVDKLRKATRASGKCLIMTVHERVIEIPNPDTRIIHRIGDKGKAEEEQVGTGTLKIVPSLEGQMAQKIGGYFDEVYALSAEPQPNGTVKYKARTVPNLSSDARTSRNLSPSVSADFSEIIKQETK